MNTKDIELSVQPRIVRDAFGHPRLAQPEELPRSQSAVVVIACAVGILIVLALRAWL